MNDLYACPVELKQANKFVDELHRHHDPVYRDKFRLGCLNNNKLVGVVQLGRPVSRYLDDGVAGGGNWNCKSRPRKTTAPQCKKQRWIKELNDR